jgi:peptidoglycan/xylan/chitin deacetylase (PgdA/CDA1 family)
MPLPSADHLLTTRVVAPILRVVRSLSLEAETAPPLPVLMYHSISDDPEPGVRGYYRLNTPPALFQEHLRVIREEGFTAVDLTTAWNEWRRHGDASSPAAPRRKLVVLTFDDGYYDFLTAAWPALEAHGFSATMFLPTAFIGKNRREFKSRACLTWAEVRELRQRGAEFGSHTVNHPKLWELSAAALDHELINSRHTLEHELAAPVTTFAHPYAFPRQNLAYVDRFCESMRKSGYHHGVTTSLGCVHHGDDSLLLKRLPVNGDDDALLLRAKLQGAYDWLAVPQKVFKAAKSLLGR